MRVLQLSANTSAAYAGLLLREWGFDVDHIDVAQAFPHIDETRQAAQSVFMATTIEGAGCAVEPHDIDLRNYDAIIEDVGTDLLSQLALDWHALHKTVPQIHLVSISAFGMTGPASGWQATDLIIQAAGGVLHVSGHEDEAPRKLPGETAAMIAGVHGATAVLAAFYGQQTASNKGTNAIADSDKRNLPEGVHIDISAQDTLMHHWCRHVADYAYSGTLTERQSRDPSGIHTRHTARANDGWVFLLALGQPWQDVAAFLGLGEFLTPDVMTPAAEQPWEAMCDAYDAAVASRSRYEWFADAADLGWTFAPVEDPWSVANGPQTNARKSMHDRHFDGKPIKVPGLPARIWSDIRCGSN